MRGREIPAMALVSCLAFGCKREERRFHEIPALEAPRSALRMHDFQPGGGPLPSAAPAAAAVNAYEAMAYSVSEGKRLFEWYNCAGCHGHEGGGGMGVPLSDAKWIYGSDPANVHASIVEGRPNGMPAFGGKIADHQIWQLAAYVRSMSGLVRLDVAPGRSDGLSGRNQPEAQRPKEGPIAGQGQQP